MKENKNILVLKVGGFIGSYFVDRLKSIKKLNWKYNHSLFKRSEQAYSWIDTQVNISKNK